MHGQQNVKVTNIICTWTENS